ncbi:MAG: SRPBCC family protein [Thermoanaerobaculia bacterium]
MSRTLDAPRDLVWRAWTEREHLLHWWGPKGFAVMSCTNDLRPGGVMHYGMRGPGDAEMWGRWVYREIVPPSKLSFVVSFSDPDGNVTRAPFSEKWPLGMLTTITLEEIDGRTVVVVHSEAIDATDAEVAMFKSFRGSMKMGWTGTLEQLEAHLSEVRS